MELFPNRRHGHLSWDTNLILVYEVHYLINIFSHNNLLISVYLIRSIIKISCKQTATQEESKGKKAREENNKKDGDDDADNFPRDEIFLQFNLSCFLVIFLSNNLYRG